MHLAILVGWYLQIRENTPDHEPSTISGLAPRQGKHQLEQSCGINHQLLILCPSPVSMAGHFFEKRLIELFLDEYVANFGSVFPLDEAASEHILLQEYKAQKNTATGSKIGMTKPVGYMVVSQWFLILRVPPNHPFIRNLK